MNCTALVLRLRKHFANSFQNTIAFVLHDEFYAIQASDTEPLKETDPAGLVLFHPFGSTQYFTVSVLVDNNCNQNRNIFVFFTSVAVQIDSIHIDVGILPILQREVAPIFDMNIGFLVQLADGGRRNLAAP